MCRCSEGHGRRRRLWGVLAGAASQGRAAVKATSSLVQVSRRGEIKHGRSPAANEWRFDGFEMDYVVWACPLMAEVAGAADLR